MRAAIVFTWPYFVCIPMCFEGVKLLLNNISTRKCQTLPARDSDIKEKVLIIIIFSYL